MDIDLAELSTTIRQRVLTWPVGAGYAWVDQDTPPYDAIAYIPGDEIPMMVQEHG